MYHLPIFTIGWFFCFTYCKGNSSIFMKYHPESRDPVDGQKSGDHQLIGKISHYLCTGFHTCQVVQDFFHQQYILGPKDYTDRILLDSGWDWIPKNPGGAWILRDMTPGSQTSYTKNNENPSKFYQQHLHQVWSSKKMGPMKRDACLEPLGKWLDFFWGYPRNNFETKR